MTQFTGIPKNQDGGMPIGQTDSNVSMEQKPGFEEAKTIADFLKGFDRKEYEIHTIEENENDRLKDFKDQYHLLQALIRKHNLTEGELGLSPKNISDIEFISMM